MEWIEQYYTLIILWLSSMFWLFVLSKWLIEHENILKQFRLEMDAKYIKYWLNQTKPPKTMPKRKK